MLFRKCKLIILLFILLVFIFPFATSLAKYDAVYVWSDSSENTVTTTADIKGRRGRRPLQR